MPETEQSLSDERPPFRVLPLVTVVLLILLCISLANQWYASNIAMPRYCDDPVQTLERVRRLLTEQKPADDNFESRRPYIIAAKLLFLVPRTGDETDADYLGRVQQHLDQQCR
jgi:hypothetical protein